MIPASKELDLVRAFLPPAICCECIRLREESIKEAAENYGFVFGNLESADSVVHACCPAVLFAGWAGKAVGLLACFASQRFQCGCLSVFRRVEQWITGRGRCKIHHGASIFTTVAVRLVLSYVFAVTLNLGVMGIAWAMRPDWIVRGAINYLRLKSGKRKQFKVI